MPDPAIDRTLIRVPDRPARSKIGGIVHAAKGIVLAPLYWLLAATHRTPGLRFRLWCCGLGLRALLSFRRPLSLHACFHLLFMPMESTRYFEFDFARRMLAGRPIARYLDVSSPRLLPVSLLDRHPGRTAEFINPNLRDLEETARYVDLLGARRRCGLHNCLIADAPFPPETFDLVTSISVLEHIPEDLLAVRQMWALLKPGGTLILTVPCMAKRSEQYIDRDEWGLLDKDREGHVFWQRFYDEDLLRQRVFCVTGEPRRVEIYGEKIAGALFENSVHKRSDPGYPYWREPYMMGTEYRYFDRLEDLPGEGVVGFLFVKTQ